MEKGIQGTVYISLQINTDGSISDITIQKGIGGGLDDEALRIIRLMPKWKPGSRKGIPVKATIYLPLKYTMQ